MTGSDASATVGGPVATGVAADRLVATLVEFGEMASLEAEWLALLGEIDQTHWWQRPAMVRAWYEILVRANGAAKVAPKLIVVRDPAKKLRAILPVFQSLAWRGPACAPRYDYAPWDRSYNTSRMPRPIPIRQVTTAASVPGTLLWIGPLCRPEICQAVYEAVLGAIAGMPGWDAVVMPAYQGPQAEIWRAAGRKLGITCRTHELGRTTLTLRNLQSFDAVVARGPKKFRQNVRRASAAAGLTYSVFEGVTDCAPHLREVARIASLSWKESGKAGQHVVIPYAGAQQAFIEQLIARPGSGCEPFIAFAHADGAAICTYVGLTHGNVLTTLLTFWDGTQAEASPGLLLLGHLIDWGHRRGLSTLDFNSTHPWIRYLADERRDILNLVFFAPTLRGKLLSLIATRSGRLS